VGKKFLHLFLYRVNLLSVQFLENCLRLFSNRKHALMRNQQDRRNFRNTGQNERDERGRFMDRDTNHGDSRSNYYQDSNDSDSQQYRRSNYGSNRGRNDWEGGNDGYGVHNRRGETYGFGSQEDDDSYRDFSTQSRNSGVRNQGGYSSYGRSNSNDGVNRGHGNQSDFSKHSNWGHSGGMGPSPYPNYGNLDQADLNEGLSYARSSGMGRDNESFARGNSNPGGRSGNQDTNSQRGKGPKGYRRSDERIEENINDALTDDDQLDASEIEVSVKNGEVTLSGTVAERDSKRRAEELAESISGVNNVENRIRVSKDSSKTGSKESPRESHSGEGNGSERNKQKQTNHANA
jgi:osmotically-inducible protein OsmY